MLTYNPPPHMDAAALIRRADALMNRWAEKYGLHDPKWLPPAGVVQWQEDAARYLAAHTLPAPTHGVGVLGEALPRNVTAREDKVLREAIKRSSVLIAPGKLAPKDGVEVLEPQPVELPDDGELEAWRSAADALLSHKTPAQYELRRAAMLLQNAYTFARKLRGNAGVKVLEPQPVAWMTEAACSSPVVTDDFLKQYPQWRSTYTIPLYRNAGVDVPAAPQPVVGSTGADWIAVGTVRVHRTGGNAGIAWSVESSGICVRDGETLYVKGNAGVMVLPGQQEGQK